MKRNERHEHWKKVITQWKNSGLTAKEFAAQQGISHNTLQAWRWRLSRKRRLSKPHFVEVITTDGNQRALTKPVPSRPPIPSSVPFEPLEVILPEGICIRVPARFEIEALRRVVVALEGR